LSAFDLVVSVVHVVMLKKLYQPPSAPLLYVLGLRGVHRKVLQGLKLTRCLDFVLRYFLLPFSQKAPTDGPQLARILVHSRLNEWQIRSFLFLLRKTMMFARCCNAEIHTRSRMQALAGAAPQPGTTRSSSLLLPLPSPLPRLLLLLSFLFYSGSLSFASLFSHKNIDLNSKEKQHFIKIMK
jgi:hypothetical protein